MACIDNVLQPPAYGWPDEAGELIIPPTKQLWAEAFSRINALKSRRNWGSAISWLMALYLVPLLLLDFLSTLPGPCSPFRSCTALSS